MTAMLDLAVHENCGPISLADISGRQGISLSYLEQLFSKLRKSNLVSSVRGPGGGYELSRESSAIYVAEIVDSVDETVDATRCGGRADCNQGQMCLAHELWSDLSVQIHQFLSNIDLASIIARDRALPVSGTVDAENIKTAEFPSVKRLSAREL